MTAHAESHVAHHFDDAEQQFEATTLGMWLFLITEVLFFGGIFAGYIIYRTKYPVAWMEGSSHLDVWLGSINTVILLCSSLAMALAVWAAQTGKRDKLFKFLLLTIVLGSAFLVIKGFEYNAKFTHHLVPVEGMFHLDHPHNPEVNSANVQLFFGFYFGMTGIHALHMVIGIGVMISLVIRARKGHFTPEYYAPVELTGLYWHFVDIVWVFLFPLLYLLG